MPLGRFSEENIERRMRVKFPARLRDAGLDARVPVAQKPEDCVFVVVGGAGKYSAFIPTFGVTRCDQGALPSRRSAGRFDPRTQANLIRDNLSSPKVELTCIRS